MISLTTTRSKIVATAVLAATAASVATIAVASTPGPARAPYAQAAGLIESNGSVSQNKAIASVTKPSAGINCIKFTDSRIDPQKVVPQATIGAAGGSVGGPGATPNGSTLMIRTDPFTACGDDPQTITVITADDTNNYADLPFYFSIA